MCDVNLSLGAIELSGCNKEVGCLAYTLTTIHMQARIVDKIQLKLKLIPSII